MKANHIITVATALLIASMTFNATATEDERAALVQKIAAAQGLTEMFDQQMDQQRLALKDMAAKMLAEAAAASGAVPTPKEQAALEKLAVRASGMFSGKEMAAAWISSYGKDLSIKDLQAILKYYQSPTGRKDVAATKAAMPAFSAWLMQESQIRATAILRDFIAELQAAKQ